MSFGVIAERGPLSFFARRAFGVEVSLSLLDITIGLEKRISRPFFLEGLGDT